MKLRYNSMDRIIIREYPNTLLAFCYNRDIALRNFRRDLEKIFTPILDWINDKLN